MKWRESVLCLLFNTRQTRPLWVIICLLLFAGLMPPHMVRAQSFDEALVLALANNPTLAAADSQYQAVRQRQITAFSASLPQVTGYVRSTTMESETRCEALTTRDDGLCQSLDIVEIDPRNRAEGWGVNATLDVFTSGKNFNDFRKARSDIRAQALSLQATEQMILLNAATVYLNVLRDEAVLGLRQKNIDVLQRRYDAVKDQFDVGIVTRTDIAQSESRLKLAESNFIRQQATLEASRANYKEVIGQLPNQLETPKTLPVLPANIDDALRLARQQSPTLLSVQENARGTEFTTYSVIGSALPKISLFGNYSVTDDPTFRQRGEEEEVTRYGIEMTMPLFTGGRSLAAINASRHVANQTAMQVHAASNQVEREVKVTWHDFHAAGGQIESSRKQITAAEIALNGVVQERELGIRSILDVLDAEEELLDARVALIQAEHARIVAAYRLLSVIGGLTHNQLDLPATP